MFDFKAIIDEIPQPLWGNWYITDRVDSGVYSEVYRIEAKKSERIDYSLLKVQPIVIDEELNCSEEQKNALLEEKRREALNENTVMHKLINCPYIAGYLDESIIPLRYMQGYVLLTRTEYLMELPSLMKKGGFPPTEENILRLAANIGRGLNAAHKQGIHHRDIKPSNFFAAPDGTFKLGDFNISGSKESVRTVSGTAGYLAPEIYRSINIGGADYTNKADIYSFGICLYQLMNDFFFPFEEECDTEQAVERRMNGEPLQVPKKASPEFGRIILRACAFDPAVRYGSMDEMLCEIENLRAMRSVAAAVPVSVPALPDSSGYYAGTAGVQPQPKPQPQRIPAQTAQVSSTKNEKKSSPKLIPLLLLLLLLAVIALIAVLINKDDNENEKNSGKTVSAYETGDVDGDGIVTESDASLLFNEYTLISAEKSSFTEKQLEAADVDGDGIITGMDAMILRRYCSYKTETDSDDILSLEKWLKQNKE